MFDRHLSLEFVYRPLNHPLPLSHPSHDSSCRALTDINLYECRDVTNAGLSVLVGANPRLETVILDYMSKIDDDGVMVLAAACPRLTTLSIASMKRLTDAAISAVAAGCPRLERLEANMCTRLTDASLSALAACANLTALNVAMAASISDAGVQALAAGCPRLALLNLAYCKVAGGGFRGCFFFFFFFFSCLFVLIPFRLIVMCVVNRNEKGCREETAKTDS